MSVPANGLEGSAGTAAATDAEGTVIMGNQLEKPETASYPSPAERAKGMVMFESVLSKLTDKKFPVFSNGLLSW